VKSRHSLTIFTNDVIEGGEVNNGFLLDTDVLIAYLRGKNEPLKQKIQDLLINNNSLYASIISLGELYVGAFKSENPTKNLFLIHELKEVIDIIELDDSTMFSYGELQAALEKAGQIIGDFDVLIAASAIINKLTLVTGNRRHFERLKQYSPGFNFEEWQLR
jgi:tRNA(fMet)-specific endonuclease VapC